MKLQSFALPEAFHFPDGGASLTFDVSVESAEAHLDFLGASLEILARRRALGFPPLGEHSLVVDVGAHVGTFAVPCARFGAYVVAVEPDPVNRALLERNVLANGVAHRVAVVGLAVAPTSFGAGKLRRPPVGGNSGQSSTAYGFGEKEAVFDVHSIGFSALLHGVTERALKIDLLKVDVEGAEWSFLPSGDLEKCVDYLDLELHPIDEHTFEERCAHLDASLRADGFEGTLKQFGTAARWWGKRAPRPLPSARPLR